MSETAKAVIDKGWSIVQGFGAFVSLIRLMCPMQGSCQQGASVYTLRHCLLQC